MRKEIKTVVYDEELRLEAYCLEGIVQPFPNHLHERYEKQNTLLIASEIKDFLVDLSDESEQAPFPSDKSYYVIGFVESGERRLSCRDQDYTINKGAVVLFNPGDSHGCVQADDGTLDYRGINITKDVMLSLTEEITGKRELPGFSQNVIWDDEISCYLRTLHELVMSGSPEFGKEENLILMLSLLIQRYGQPFEECIPECREEIDFPVPFGPGSPVCRLPPASEENSLPAGACVYGSRSVRRLSVLSAGKYRPYLHHGFQCGRYHFCRAIFYSTVVPFPFETGRKAVCKTVEGQLPVLYCPVPGNDGLFHWISYSASPILLFPNPTGLKYPG